MKDIDEPSGLLRRLVANAGWLWRQGKGGLLTEKQNIHRQTPIPF